MRSGLQKVTSEHPSLHPRGVCGILPIPLPIALAYPRNMYQQMRQESILSVLAGHDYHLSYPNWLKDIILHISPCGVGVTTIVPSKQHMSIPGWWVDKPSHAGSVPSALLKRHPVSDYPTHHVWSKNQQSYNAHLRSWIPQLSRFPTLKTSSSIVW